MSIRLLFIVSGLLFNLCGTAFAQTNEPATTRWYEVEVVVFRQNLMDGIKAEHWTPNWTTPDLKNAVDLDNITGNKRDLIRKVSAGRKLGGVAARLNKSGRYVVLNHSAWQQKGLSKDQTFPIMINGGGVRNGNYFNAATSNNGNGQEPIKTAELLGTVTVVLSRYLHVYTNFLLTEAVNIQQINSQTGSQMLSIEPAAQSTTLFGFNNQQHRRMRSSEIHHIDHPLIGVTIIITPL
ncbi:MAG: peptidoglycan binding protein CsiV [Gammaproteobacteria bacterium]|nr:peptidoglycan binding protein CsiV [Gammaproteobacteria bacterium]